jgi:hypothetical protein
MEPHSITINIVSSRINSKIEELEKAERSLQTVSLYVASLKGELEQLNKTLLLLKGGV